jgi:transposase InsO family protein
MNNSCSKLQAFISKAEGNMAVRKFIASCASREKFVITNEWNVSPLVHSDRGSQYASVVFREQLSRYGCEQSMSRKGNCWDNAVAESFFSGLKLELIYEARYEKRQEARDQVFEYIEVFYNRRRIHSAVGYVSPAEYEEKFKEAA